MDHTPTITPPRPRPVWTAALVVASAGCVPETPSCERMCLSVTTASEPLSTATDAAWPPCAHPTEGVQLHPDTPCLHGVCLGDTVEDVEATVGAPEHCVGDGYTRWCNWETVPLTISYVLNPEHPGYSLDSGDVLDPVVQAVVVQEGAASTDSAGFVLGSSISCALDLWGSPDELEFWANNALADQAIYGLRYQGARGSLRVYDAPRTRRSWTGHETIDLHVSAIAIEALP